MITTRQETLVIVKRCGRYQIELREVLHEGDKAFLVFARSDGSEVQVEVDPSKLFAVPKGRVEAKFLYRGGTIKAPKQDVGT